MRRAPIYGVVLMLVVGGLGCARVNVYVSWPSLEQLGQATDAIVDEARPGLPDSAAPAGASSRGSREVPPSALGLAGSAGRTFRVLLAGVPGGGAGAFRVVPAQMSLEVSTPTIRRIKVSLAKRFPQLLPHYRAGRIGENNLGLLALRSTAGLSLKERSALGKLVAAENEDRMTLYREFLRANRLDPTRLADLQRQFARSWQKKAEPGWYIQTEKGRWLKKPRPKPGPAT